MRTGKRTGIHILINEDLAEKIVNCVNVRGKDVLEVGPGTGALTNFIKGYRRLYLIEKQVDFINELKVKFPDSEILSGDALRIEWPKFDIFISNMPYNITSPLLEKLQKYKFDEAVITIQKEVADRILAKPGSKEFSRLSVGMQLIFTIEKCFNISPSNFRPIPKVYSTVLKIRPTGRNLPQGFDEFLKLLFSSRRKMISGILKDKALPNKRPEELSPFDLLDLYLKINGRQF